MQYCPFSALSATMRRISLATRIVAPVVIGQILKRTSHPTGALVVAGWNFMTIFLEYFLLWKIYRDVPQLQRIKIKGSFILFAGRGRHTCGKQLHQNCFCFVNIFFYLKEITLLSGEQILSF